MGHTDAGGWDVFVSEPAHFKPVCTMSAARLKPLCHMQPHGAAYCRRPGCLHETGADAVPRACRASFLGWDALSLL